MVQLAAWRWQRAALSELSAAQSVALVVVWLALWVKELVRLVPVLLVLPAAAVLVLSVAVPARVLRVARLAAAEVAARQGRVPAAAAAVVSVPALLLLALVPLAAAVPVVLARLAAVPVAPVVDLQPVARRLAKDAARQARGLLRVVVLLAAVRRRQEVVGLPVASLLVGLWPRQVVRVVLVPLAAAVPVVPASVAGQRFWRRLHAAATPAHQAATVALVAWLQAQDMRRRRPVSERSGHRRFSTIQ